MDPQARQIRSVWIIAGLIALGYGLSFWPGTMNPDARDMLSQGIASSFNDWHSPLLSWAWGILDRVIAGPGGLFAVSLTCLVAGHAAVATCFVRAGMPGRALACMLVLVFPVTAYALLDVGKDTFLAATLMVLVGAILSYAQRPRRILLMFLPCIVAVLLMATDARKNAFAALIPIIAFTVFCSLPNRRLTPRGMLLAVALMLTAQACTWLIDHKLLRASDAHELVSLEIFDLSGESYYAGTDVSQGLLGADFMTQTQACYDHRAWDAFRWGTCGATGQAALDRLYGPDGPAYAHALFRVWIEGILQHPSAYLWHRTAYWLTLLRWQCDGCDGDLRSRADASVVIWWLWDRPYLWLLELLACLGICLRHADRRPRCVFTAMGLCLSASGLLYALSYLPFGVADPPRYLLWTYLTGLLAPILASAPLAATISAVRVGLRT